MTKKEKNIRVYFFKNFISALLIVSLFSVIFPLCVSAEDYELYIAQGIQKINDGKISDALGLLKKALKLSPDNSEATYYAGIAHSRAGNYKEAEDLFLKMLQMDEDTVIPYFELGRLYYITSRCDKTEEFLSKFIAISDNADLVEYAARLVEICKEESSDKPYRLAITAGYQYDDNVLLEASDPTTASGDRKSDSRAIVYITSGATLLKKGALNLKVDYNFYQSLHMNLEDYDVHYHKIMPFLEVDVSDIFKPSAGYSLEYVLLDGERYSRVNTYFGKFSLKESGKLSTEAIYEYKDDKYWDSDSFQTSSLRTGFQNIIGIRQNFYLNRLSGEIYYFRDFERTKVKYWAFDGYRAGAELAYEITSPLIIGISGEFSRKQYLDDHPDFQEKRLDKIQQYSLSLTYMISKRVAVSITDTCTVNDSNLKDYDYKRNIIGIFLTGGLL